MLNLNNTKDMYLKKNKIKKCIISENTLMKRSNKLLNLLNEYILKSSKIIND